MADFATRLNGQLSSLDILINNAAAKIPPQALDTEASARLWKVSEALTGAVFH